MRLLQTRGGDPPASRRRVRGRAGAAPKDQGIRQGIKAYSDWATIPQLYGGGEFVGGSDIMMEMYESGELAELFEGAAKAD